MELFICKFSFDPVDKRKNLPQEISDKEWYTMLNGCSSEYIKRAKKFHFVIDGVRHVIGYYLALLGRFDGEWRIIRKENCKPEYNVKGYDFNISHDEELVVCLRNRVKNVGKVGVDVMRWNDKGRLDLLQDCFTPFEWKKICHNGKPSGFLLFRFWTLKEAFIKMIGYGVSFGLQRIEFRNVGENTDRFKEQVDVYIDGKLVDPSLYRIGWQVVEKEYILASAICVASFPYLKDGPEDPNSNSNVNIGFELKTIDLQHLAAISLGNS